MAKFITKFDTVNAYNEAAPSFDLPHVSLTKDDMVYTIIHLLQNYMTIYTKMVHLVRKMRQRQLLVYV